MGFGPRRQQGFSVQPGAGTYLFCLREDRDVLACVTVKSSIRTISPGEDDPDIKLDFSYIHEVSEKPTGYSAEISYTTDTRRSGRWFLESF